MLDRLMSFLTEAELFQKYKQTALIKAKHYLKKIIINWSSQLSVQSTIYLHFTKTGRNYNDLSWTIFRDKANYLMVEHMTLQFESSTLHYIPIYVCTAKYFWDCLTYRCLIFIFEVGKKTFRLSCQISRPKSPQNWYQKPKNGLIFFWGWRLIFLWL